MDLSLTVHGRARNQQRAFTPERTNLLIAFGSEMRHKGADILFFDKAARRRMEAELSLEELRRVSRQDTNAYMVLGDQGRVVTVGFRRRRFKRP